MTIAKCPHVYRAINLITAEFAKDGIPKLHANLPDQYLYRSIDDVMNRLAPLLARHRLCALPRVLHHDVTEHDQGDGLLRCASVRVAYKLVSCRDGSRHTIESCGEALDPGDKATPKALSAAYKSAMLQAFCVPVAGEDADATTHRLKTGVRATEPVQGWPAWTNDILDMISGCERLDALNRVRTRQAELLAALKRERPDFYAQVGERFAERSEQLAAPQHVAQVRTATRKKERADGQPLPA